MITWFFIGYFWVGLMLLIEPIVYTWDTRKEVSTLARILGSLVALVFWPLMFFLS